LISATICGAVERLQTTSANKPEIAVARNARGSSPGVANRSIVRIKAWRAERMIWCAVPSSSARWSDAMRSILAALV
jgi:hypothetical protein